MSPEFGTLVEPVFIVGCPRSGTTLVAAKLDDSADLAVAPETHFFSEWLVRFPALKDADRVDFDIFWEAFRTSNKFRWLGLDDAAVLEQLVSGGSWDGRSVFSCLLSNYAAARGKGRVGEKTPTHYRALSTLFDWYPTAKAVFVVRDPRAVVASYFEMPDRVAWARGSALAIARRWRDAARSADRWRGDGRVVLIHYEVLVKDPVVELERLRNALGMGGERGKAAASHSQWPGAGGLVPSAEISSDRVDRWRSQLSPGDVQVVERVCGATMRRLGYEPETRLTPRGMGSLASQGTGTLLAGATAKVRRERFYDGQPLERVDAAIPGPRRG